MVVFEFVVGLAFLFLAALCSMRGLSSMTRDQTCAPASGAWSPHHCTTSPFPSLKGKPPWKWLHQNIGFPWGLRQYRIQLQCRRPGCDSWVGKLYWRRELFYKTNGLLPKFPKSFWRPLPWLCCLQSAELLSGCERGRLGLTPWNMWAPGSPSSRALGTWCVRLALRCSGQRLGLRWPSTAREAEVPGCRAVAEAPGEGRDDWHLRWRGQWALGQCGLPMPAFFRGQGTFNDGSVSDTKRAWPRRMFSCLTV